MTEVYRQLQRLSLEVEGRACDVDCTSTADHVHSVDMKCQLHAGELLTVATRLRSVVQRQLRLSTDPSSLVCKPHSLTLS